MLPSNSGQDISDRVHLAPDMEHIFPVCDCPKCGRPDTPFGVVSLMGEEIKVLYYCLNCDYVTNESRLIKGWVTYLDLEECEWSEEI